MERPELKIEKSVIKFLWIPSFIAYGNFDAKMYHTSHNDKV